jgi:hypothetical protein
MDYDSGILCDDCFNRNFILFNSANGATYSLLLVATTLETAMAKFKSDLSKWLLVLFQFFIWFCSFTVAICVYTDQVQHIISKLQT